MGPRPDQLARSHEEAGYAHGIDLGTGPDLLRTRPGYHGAAEEASALLFRSFRYPMPNACWQLDATEYVLEGGRKWVIFQLIDDHSRLAVASLAAKAENSADAVKVFRKGIEARGVPQRLLTDNGDALNPIRRGVLSELVAYASGRGIAMITGKPYKPTTQSKNQRFHSTLFKWLKKQPFRH